VARVLEHVQPEVRIVTVREFLQSDMRTGEIDLGRSAPARRIVNPIDAARGYRVMIGRARHPTGLSGLRHFRAGGPEQSRSALRPAIGGSCGVRPEALQRAKYIGRWRAPRA